MALLTASLLPFAVFFGTKTHKFNSLSLSLHPISVARSSCICNQPCAFKRVATAPEGHKKRKEIPGPSSSRLREEEKLLPKLGTGKFPQCLLRTHHPNPPNWSECIASKFSVILALSMPEATSSRDVPSYISQGLSRQQE